MSKYIKFADGTRFELLSASGKPERVAGHLRDVLTLKLTGTYETVKAAFSGQAWVHHFAELLPDGTETECAVDRSGYQIVAGITDNMDGTVTVRVSRNNTREESLEDELAAEQAKTAALTEENAALTAENQDKDAQIDDLVVAMLEGGTDDVSETETAV